MRGHGALLGAMDTTVHVVKADSVRTATVVKANDSEEGERVAFTLDSVVIAKGSDGVDTTAPVVVPAEPSSGAMAKALRRISDRHKLALTALTEATLSWGQPAPSAYQLPADIQVVAADKWREEPIPARCWTKPPLTLEQTSKESEKALQLEHLSA